MGSTVKACRAAREAWRGVASIQRGDRQGLGIGAREAPSISMNKRAQRRLGARFSPFTVDHAALFADAVQAPRTRHLAAGLCPALRERLRRSISITIGAGRSSVSAVTCSSHLNETRVSGDVHPTVVVDVRGVDADNATDDLPEREKSEAVCEIHDDAKPPDVDPFRHHVHGDQPRIVRRRESPDCVRRARGRSR